MSVRKIMSFLSPYWGLPLSQSCPERWVNRTFYAFDWRQTSPIDLLILRPRWHSVYLGPPYVSHRYVSPYHSNCHKKSRFKTGQCKAPLIAHTSIAFRCIWMWLWSYMPLRSLTLVDTHASNQIREQKLRKQTSNWLSPILCPFNSSTLSLLVLYSCEYIVWMDIIHTYSIHNSHVVNILK